MAEKDTQLSITIRAVDRATAVVRAISAKVASVAKPIVSDIKGLGSALGSALSSIGSAIGSVLDKIPLIGGVIAGVVGGAVAAVVHLVDKFDMLGKTAERVGVGVDFLAGLRYAAEKTGAPLEALDEGLQTFSQNLGQARAGAGRMVKFLSLVSPALLQQLKAAKSNEAAFLLLSDAMAKLTDPAKRAALAQKTVGDAALAPLLARGAKSIKALGDEHERLAGSMTGATSAAAEAKEAMIDLHAAVDGAEAGIVVGLAPALKVIVEQLSEWFVAHRADITEWAKTVGEKIPGAFKAIVGWVGDAIEKLGKFLGVLETIYDTVKKVTDAVAVTTTDAEKAVLEEGPRDGEDIPDFLARMHHANFDAASAAALAAMQNAAKVSVNAAKAPADGGAVVVQENALRDKAATAVQARPMSPTANDAGASPGSQAPARAEITMTIKNAPPGTRVTTDPKSTADVDLNVGYQMAGAQ